MKSRTKTWGNISPQSFCDTINGTVYDEIVHFRRNIFNVPSGGAGKAFIEELTIWIKQLKFEFGSKALKAFMVLPALILKAVRYFEARPVQEAVNAETVGEATSTPTVDKKR